MNEPTFVGVTACTKCHLIMADTEERRRDHLNHHLAYGDQDDPHHQPGFPPLKVGQLPDGAFWLKLALTLLGAVAAAFGIIAIVEWSMGETPFWWMFQ